MTNRSICADGYEADVQLDPYNSRARLVGYQGDTEKIIEALKRICREHQFGKLICMPFIRATADRLLTGAFYRRGQSADFSGEKMPNVFSCFFRSAACEEAIFFQRRMRSSRIVRIIDLQDDLPEISEGSELRKRRTPKKSPVLFREVFPFYPTPMDEPEYVKKMMDQDVLFKVLEKDGVLASVASADMNREFLHAEITDCATRASFRGKWLSQSAGFFFGK
jgi:hypothetical protein